MKKMRKRTILIIASALVITATPLTLAETAYAAGWTKEGGDWKYLDGNNQAVSDVWREDGGSYYFLGSDGRMVTDNLIRTEDGLYYVEGTGKRVKNQWVQITGEEGRIDQVGGEDPWADGWYYFGANGKAFNYGGATGVKKQIDGKTYAFDDTGRMITGWINENGEPLEPDASPLMDGVSYAGEDGALLKDQWLNYSYSGEILAEDTDIGPDGIDYSNYPEIWMYFDSDCRRIRGSEEKTRQKVINGNTYGFDVNGVMLPWWNPVASGSDAGKDSKNEMKFFSGSAGGELQKDSWIWMYPSKEMDEKDYEDQEYSWWHTDKDGNLDRNRIKKINGNYYAFDSLGRMQTGFVLFQGKNSFAAQYNLDVWTADDFKKPDQILGIEGADLYLFGPDELNDGSMKTGKDIKVELADDVYTFGFDDDGIAYGNRNKLQKAKNSFYINGLRLEADEDFKYGVVRDQKGTCYVVDAKGRIVTGEKKVLEDGEGGFILIRNGKYLARVEDEDKPRWHDGEDGPGFYHYDSGSKDKYGALIANSTTPPDWDALPGEERLYDARQA